MSPCPDERQSIGDNLPWPPLTTRGNHGGAYSSPGPTRGHVDIALALFLFFINLGTSFSADLKECWRMRSGSSSGRAVGYKSEVRGSNPSPGQVNVPLLLCVHPALNG
ncbi:hypothetical protein PoB_001353700 [Plakobranchus ocellatus]|uniref:Uncharacterized protein n=1 Tax=Plakobranchus ocellatus TaxID=259542 RepID=A0AAV3YVM8_9GAST|nr:hypothetical protein PoB_001353700 [Plakobranchus ocellatus]